MRMFLAILLVSGPLAAESAAMRGTMQPPRDEGADPALWQAPAMQTFNFIALVWFCHVATVRLMTTYNRNEFRQRHPKWNQRVAGAVVGPMPDFLRDWLAPVESHYIEHHKQPNFRKWDNAEDINIDRKLRWLQTGRMYVIANLMNMMTQLGRFQSTIRGKDDFKTWPLMTTLAGYAVPIGLDFWNFVKAMDARIEERRAARRAAQVADIEQAEAGPRQPLEEPLIQEPVLEDCMICMMGYERGERPYRLQCNHEFHASCIQHWLQAKGRDARCPYCRADIYGQRHEIEAAQLDVNLNALPEQQREKKRQLVLGARGHGLTCRYADRHGSAPNLANPAVAQMGINWVTTLMSLIWAVNPAFYGENIFPGESFEGEALPLWRLMVFALPPRGDDDALLALHHVVGRVLRPSLAASSAV
jgi:hypothetical protein